MAKKVIRLTEADIENIVKSVIEEQRSGGSLTGPKKRKVPKEKKSNVPNWDGGLTGKLDFSKRILADNVSQYNFEVKYSNQVGNWVGKPSSETPDRITIPEFIIEGSSLPYADNMVMPYFDEYEGSKEKFEDILKSFVDYINAGGGDKLTNVTIKGSADSARPTLTPPSGYSSLDHPGGTPYNGKTDPKEMNQYLADMRAKQYAKVLIDSVKEQTGFDLNIEVLSGDNYYGQGDDKRGIEYRTITLTPNAPEHKVEIITPGSRAVKKEKETIITPAKIEIWVDGAGQYVDGYNVDDKMFNKNWLAISKDVAISMGILERGVDFDGNISAGFRGQDFYINGHKVGGLKKWTDLRVNLPGIYDIEKMENDYFIGPVSFVMAYRKYEINGESVLLAQIEDAYFTFSR